MKPAAVVAETLRGVSSAVNAGQRSLGDLDRVCRFLAGRLEFQTRPSDLYVATYPRSGTTWVQFIVYLLHSDGALAFDHLSEVSPWFERSMALGTKRAQDFEQFSAPRCFKTHLTPEWLPTEGRIIYVERDPLDVAVSYYHLYRSHLRYRGSFDEFFERFLRGELQYRSWFDHVDRWRRYVDANPDRVLSLRYEQMLEDLPGAIARIAAFVGVELSPHRAAQVEDQAGFDFMRAHQQKFDPVTETMIDQGWIQKSFIRAGKRGQGRAQLTHQQRQRFEDARRAWRRPRAGEWRIHDFLH